MSIRRFKKFNFNGWKFRTKDIEKNASTENSGIAVEGIGTTTHGELVYEMIELDYYEERLSSSNVIGLIWEMVEDLSRICLALHWWTLIGCGKLMSHLCWHVGSQATQVIYTPNPIEESWNVVTSFKPGHVYDIWRDDYIDNAEIDFDYLPSIDLTVDLEICNDIITESKILETDDDDLKCDDDSDNDQEANEQDEVEKGSDDNGEDETLYDYDDGLNGWNTIVMS